MSYIISPSMLTVIAKVRWMPKLPSQQMTIRNFEALRLMCNAIILEREGKIQEAEMFEKQALEQMEKELRDYLGGIKHTLEMNNGQDVAVHRQGEIL